jgi:hypothetical protein
LVFAVLKAVFLVLYLGQESSREVFDMVVEMDTRIEASLGKLICLEVCLKVSRVVELFVFGVLL